MNRIMVTGDIHGDCVSRFASHNFPVGVTLDRTDLVISVGDFGVIWLDDPKSMKVENYRLDWLNDKPWTTLFIGGNHENWDRLHALPKIKKFGVELGQVRENIFFVPNGTILEYAGKKIFCFGGAMSTDRGGLDPNAFYPEEGKGWWRSEIPSKDEMDYGIANLNKAGGQVDIIITHTMPDFCVQDLVDKMGWSNYQARVMDPTSRFLSHVHRFTKFKSWYCGHFHTRASIHGVDILYYDIIDVDEPNLEYFHDFEKGRLW